MEAFADWELVSDEEALELAEYLVETHRAASADELRVGPLPDDAPQP